ncbi:MAG: hypothetical protein KKE57_06315 [Proteobacteria bacterium]|nr:hypothetical protein [Pseudomonadota bacterium]
MISSLLSNIYLHYVLDLWIKKKAAKEVNGRVFLIRYADDFVIGSTNREDAEKVWEMLPTRLKQFGLEHSQEGKLVQCHIVSRKSIDLRELYDRYSDLGCSAYHPRMTLKVFFMDMQWGSGVFVSSHIG